MKNKTVQFNCKDCKQDVFRLGKKVNKELRLCGKCNKTNTVHDLIDYSKEEMEVRKTIMSLENPSNNIVLDKINQYRYYLNKMESLFDKYPNLTFTELLNYVKSL